MPEGATTITAIYLDIAVESVSLSQETLELEADQKATLRATINPGNAANQEVTWSSSAPQIAKVSQDGEITALARGTATITVTTADGSHTAQCEVTVNSLYTYELINGEKEAEITDYHGLGGDLVIPNEFAGRPLTKIASAAFYQKGLTRVVIPETVTTIEGSAFTGNMLKEIKIPDQVTEIGDLAFAENQLRELTIPASVTSINSRAFYGNELTDLTILPGVKSIGEWAFYWNSLSSVIIPSTVTSIGNNSF